MAYETKAFRLYGKDENMKRFSPMGDGNFVVNLIYADVYFAETEDRVLELKQWVKNLNTDNPAFDFELRKVA